MCFLINDKYLGFNSVPENCMVFTLKILLGRKYILSPSACIEQIFCFNDCVLDLCSMFDTKREFVGLLLLVA